MSILKFTTVAERKFEVPFVDIDFFKWMEINGYPNLKIENQVCLYLNYKYQSLLNVQGESVISINYIFSDEFIKRFNFINDALIYRL